MISTEDFLEPEATGGGNRQGDREKEHRPKDKKDPEGTRRGGIFASLVGRPTSYKEKPEGWSRTNYYSKVHILKVTAETCAARARQDRKQDWRGGNT